MMFLQIGIKDHGYRKDEMHWYTDHNFQFHIVCWLMERLEPRVRFETVARCAVAGDLVPLTATAPAYI